MKNTLQQTSSGPLGIRTNVQAYYLQTAEQGIRELLYFFAQAQAGGAAEPLAQGGRGPG